MSETFKVSFQYIKQCFMLQIMMYCSMCICHAAHQCPLIGIINILILILFKVYYDERRKNKFNKTYLFM